MPNKLSDSEIKKALECCIKIVGGKCYECPYEDTHGCEGKLIENALDLINRLQAENERLTIRLRKAEHQLDDLCKMHNIIKAEAYKEFAERLKESYSEGYTTGFCKVLCEELDNLLKELVGEPDES